MSDHFGAGPGLTRYLDFAVAHDGDLDIAYGEYELRKDLAFQMHVEFRDFKGRKDEAATEKAGEITARNVANRDPRVERVPDVTAWMEDIETLRVELSVETADDDIVIEEIFDV